MEVNNKLIAEFIGAKFVHNKFRFPTIIGKEGKNFFEEHELKFHSRWNWLMDVIKKIDDILYKESVNYIVGESALDDFYDLELRGLRYHSNTIFVSSNIEEVYESVVEFINWYNQIKEDE